VAGASVYAAPPPSGMLAAVVSQAAIRLLDAAPVPGQPHLVHATIELRCGCRISETIAADRILERESGERFAVGKYRCPRRHPAA
jgi:hypothetical protein